MTLTIDKTCINRRNEAAYNALIDRAEALLVATKAPIHSVVYKSVVPPSGDKHDYMSLAPYWWPDYANDTFVARDGEVNPASRTMEYDGMRLECFAAEVLDLALAYHFTADNRYKTRGELFLETWFLEEDTKMNPNLRYAQAIPGYAEGRGVGLIDSRHFSAIIDAILILGVEAAPYKAWFADYQRWLVNSDFAPEADGQNNSHGTFYDAHVALIALFLDQPQVAEMRVLKSASRAQLQFDNRGQQPHELSRKLGFQACCFNLSGYMRLCNYGRLIDSPITSTTFLKAVEHLALWYVNDRLNLSPDTETLFLSILLQTMREYGGDRHELNNSFKRAKVRLSKTSREWLMY